MKSNFITAILLASTALCSASLGARAGDMPSARAASAPVAAHEFDWTGPYGSVYAGAAADTSATTSEFGASDIQNNMIGDSGYPYTPPGYQSLISNSYLFDSYEAQNIYYTSTSNAVFTASPNLPLIPTSFGEGNKILGAAGVELGYNKQMGHAVVGIAGDFTFLSHTKPNLWQSSSSYAASGTGSSGCTS